MSFESVGDNTGAVDFGEFLGDGLVRDFDPISGVRVMTDAGGAYSEIWPVVSVEAPGEEAGIDAMHYTGIHPGYEIDDVS